MRPVCYNYSVKSALEVAGREESIYNKRETADRGALYYPHLTSGKTGGGREAGLALCQLGEERGD